VIVTKYLDVILAGSSLPLHDMAVNLIEKIVTDNPVAMLSQPYGILTIF
jgi:hypothetical protein